MTQKETDGQHPTEHVHRPSSVPDRENLTESELCVSDEDGLRGVKTLKCQNILISNYAGVCAHTHSVSDQRGVRARARGPRRQRARAPRVFLRAPLPRSWRVCEMLFFIINITLRSML